MEPAYHDGDMLIVAQNGKVCFWETETWTKVRELNLRYPRVTELMLTPDGARLITVSSEQGWMGYQWMAESWGIQ